MSPLTLSPNQLALSVSHSLLLILSSLSFSFLPSLFIPGPLSRAVPRGVSALQRSPVSLQCGVTGAPTYWSHDGTVVQGGQDGGGPLVFSHVTMEDTGEYTCTGVESGALVQSSVTLTVHEREGTVTVMPLS